MNLKFWKHPSNFIWQPERYLLKKQIQKYAHYIKGVVLDVGVGKFKRYADYFNCSKYITLDINANSHADIIGSAEKIPLASESVDSIICTQVLGDIKEPEKALKEFYRLLRPNGVILLTESLINQVHDEPNDFWRFTSFSLDYLFKKTGFKIISIDQRGGFFSSIAQLKIRYLIDRFDLYKHWWGRFINWGIVPYGKLMLFLDKIDKSKANAKQALGWCLVAKK